MIRKYHNHKLQTTPGNARKSRPTTTRHQEDKLSKAISPLFPIKMIAILVLVGNPNRKKMHIFGFVGIF